MDKLLERMCRCCVKFEHRRLVGDSERGILIGWEIHSRGDKTYLPELDGLFKTYIKAVPAFEIPRVSTTLLKSFLSPLSRNSSIPRNLSHCKLVILTRSLAGFYSVSRFRTVE